jgi:Tol biopolymer transport system component
MKFSRFSVLCSITNTVMISGLLISGLSYLTYAEIAHQASAAEVRSELSFRRVLEGAEVPSEPSQVSPDGQSLAFVRSGNLFVRNLSSGTIRQISKFENDGAADPPLWSRDSRQLAVAITNHTSLISMNGDGTAARVLYKATNGTRIFPKAWSADGARLLIRTVSSSSAQLSWLSISKQTLGPIPTSATPDNNATLSGDGRYIAYYGRPVSNGVSQLFVITSDGLQERSSSNALPDGQLIGWMPDSKNLLILRGATLWALPVTDGKIAAPPLMLNRNLGTGLHGIPSVVTLGITDGGSVYYRNSKPTSDIYTANLDRDTGRVVSDPKPLPLARPGDNVLPRWSPDGQKILYHWVQWAPADNMIYSIATGHEERVVSNVPSAAICWVDNGSSILAIPYVGGASPYQGLVRVNLQTGESVQLAKPSANMIPLNCAGDLVTLATQDALRVYNIASRIETVLYRYRTPTNTRPSLSHDAKSVAVVTSVAPGTTSLLVVTTSGGEVKELLRLSAPEEFQQTFFGFTWSPDDRYVYFLKRPDPSAPYELFRITTTGGTVQNIGLKFPALRDIDLSPDGAKIAFSVGDPIHAEIWAIDNVLLAAPH